VATKQFYRIFFHHMVCDFSARFRDARFRAQLQRRIERVMGMDRHHFIAVDDTWRREMFTDLITFFDVTYGGRCELHLTGGTARVRSGRGTH
jgi:hypothetical protein